MLRTLPCQSGQADGKSTVEMLEREYRQREFRESVRTPCRLAQMRDPDARRLPNSRKRAAHSPAMSERSAICRVRASGSRATSTAHPAILRRTSTNHDQSAPWVRSIASATIGPIRGQSRSSVPSASFPRAPKSFGASPEAPVAALVNSEEGRCGKQRLRHAAVEKDFEISRER